MVPAPSSALKHEWMLIGFVVLLNAAFLIAEAFEFPLEQGQGKLTLRSILAMVFTCLAQVGWISMDRRRRGRVVSFWRFAVLLVGPVAVALYLILEYRLRALYLIPLIAVYAAGLLLPAGILLALGR